MSKAIKKIGIYALCLALLLTVLGSIGSFTTKVLASRATITGQKGATYIYDSLDEAAGDFTSMTSTTLQELGWYTASWAEEYYKLTYSAERSSDVIEAQDLANGGRNQLYTPMIDINDMVSFKVRVDACFYGNNPSGSSPNLRVYMYYYKADGTYLSNANKGITSLTADEWKTYSTVEMTPVADAAYVQLMIQTIGKVQMDDIAVIGVPNEPSMVNEDFSTTTIDRLVAEGWNAKTGSISDFSVVDLDGNKVLKRANSTFATPLIDVSGMTQVTFYMEAKSDGEAGRYLYFYESNGTTLVDAFDAAGKKVNGYKKVTSGGSDWNAETLTVDVPANVKYMQYATYYGNDVVYYDNIAVNHVHDFSKKSTMVAQAASGSTPAAYYGECECGAVSHVVTISDAPVTSTPETSAPATSAPATSAPATSAPATSAPATSAPATSAPATSAPATSAPAGTNPDTGDTTGITGMLVVMILAATTLVAMVVGTKFNFGYRK